MFVTIIHQIISVTLEMTPHLYGLSNIPQLKDAIKKWKKKASV